MKRSQLQKSVVTGLTAVTLTTALFGNVNVLAESKEVPLDQSPEGFEEWYEEQIRNAVHVSFEDLAISLTAPPRLVNEVMMVPARPLLEGLGYSLTWNPENRSLSAVHDNRPFLAFVEDSLQSPLGAQVPEQLLVAPFIEDGTMWIPLRAAAESARLSVKWDERSRLALVSDPQALPKFDVMTQVMNNVIDTPITLLNHMENTKQAKVQISWVPPDHYQDKAKVMIAAGEMDDLTLFNDPYMLNDEITKSVVIDLSDYLSDYPTLKQLASGVYGTRVIDGHTYAIPRLSDAHNASFPSVRKDWLDRFGLEVPKTMGELYEVMKVFAKQDPDGDSQANTWGFTGFGLQSLNWVEYAFTGSPERFSIQDGKVIDHAVSSQETEALQWLARAYKDGLLDPDFAVMSSDQVKQKIASGQAGLAAMTIEEAAGFTEEQAVWLPLSVIQASASSSPIAPWSSQGAGAYVISSMSKDDPAVILDWLEYGMTMTLENKWSELEDWTSADQTAVHALFGQPDMLKNNTQLDNLPSDIQDQYESAVEQWRKVSYEDRLIPEAGVLRSTPEYAELFFDLERKKIEFIVGAISLEQWNSYVQDMTKSQNYKDMMAELQELLDNRS